VMRLMSAEAAASQDRRETRRRRVPDAQQAPSSDSHQTRIPSHTGADPAPRPTLAGLADQLVPLTRRRRRPPVPLPLPPRPVCLSLQLKRSHPPCLRHCQRPSPPLFASSSSRLGSSSYTSCRGFPELGATRHRPPRSCTFKRLPRRPSSASPALTPTLDACRQPAVQLIAFLLASLALYPLSGAMALVQFTYESDAWVRASFMLDAAGRALCA
jgi:hypothetical protein